MYTVYKIANGRISNAYTVRESMSRRAARYLAAVSTTTGSIPHLQVSY